MGYCEQCALGIQHPSDTKCDSPSAKRDLFGYAIDRLWNEIAKAFEPLLNFIERKLCLKF